MKFLPISQSNNKIMLNEIKITFCQILSNFAPYSLRIWV